MTQKTLRSRLKVLYVLASQNQLNEAGARGLYMILDKHLKESVDSSAQLKAMKAELTDKTFRIMELEEELAEARKPRRRTRKKQDAEPTAESDKPLS